MRTRTSIVIIILMVIFATMAGCVPSVSSENDLLVEYRQTGGLAGLDNSLKLQKDGQGVVIYNDRRFDVTVSSDKLQRLERLLKGARFAELDGERNSADACCDLVEYRITWQGHTVSIVDGDEAPNEIWEAIGLLNDVIKQGAERTFSSI